MGTGEKLQRGQRVHRILQIIEAITEDGPLPYTELKNRLGLRGEERIGDLVRHASNAGILKGYR